MPWFLLRPFFRCGGAHAACLAALLALAAQGCAAYQATQQPGKKNLAVLAPGTPRSHVIAELGAPIWSEERDGQRVDLFTFKQGYTKPVKAGRALVHGAADVVTGGLWEVVGIPAESLADGKDVKVEIVYDDRRAVKTMEVIAGQDVITPRRWFSRKRKTTPVAETLAMRNAPAETDPEQPVDETAPTVSIDDSLAEVRE
jgi:hypothetical protein